MKLVKACIFCCFFISFQLSAQFMIPARDLMTSAINQNMEKVKEYVENGADINEQHEIGGRTALHYAYIWADPVNFGETEDVPDIAKYLLAHGADPTIKDYDGKIPSDYQKFEDEKGKRIDRASYLELLRKHELKIERQKRFPLWYKIKSWCGGLFK